MWVISGISSSKIVWVLTNDCHIKPLILVKLGVASTPIYQKSLNKAIILQHNPHLQRKTFTFDIPCHGQAPGWTVKQERPAEVVMTLNIRPRLHHQRNSHSSSSRLTRLIQFPYSRQYWQLLGKGKTGCYVSAAEQAPMHLTSKWAPVNKPQNFFLKKKKSISRALFSHLIKWK